MEVPDSKVNSEKVGFAHKSKRTVSVRSLGEVVCPPDVIQLGLSVFSTKDTLEAAQESVQRRTDYIYQALRINCIKEANTESSTNISKEDDGCTRVQTDITVNCDSIVKFETIRNLLIEKMDSSSVHISPILYHHSSESKEDKRQEAFKRAVSNAKSKAQSICQTVGIKLGPAIEVTELSQDTVLGLHSIAEALEPDTDKAHVLRNNLHWQFNKEALIFKSQVFVIFESHPLLICIHKKCKKHSTDIV